MTPTQAKTFIVAETAMIDNEVDKLMDHLGVPLARQASDGGMDPIRFSDAYHSMETVAELAGRLCYKSFMPGLNPNVTRIREGNKAYLGNVLKQSHGSVFEHCSTSVVFCDVSRIFTHEMVRHRPGMAYSQESHRFVRLDSFDVYIPDLTPVLEAAYEYVDHDKFHDEEIEPSEVWAQKEQQWFVENVQTIKDEVRGYLQEMVDVWGMNHPDMPFHIKKQLTSALRRMVPGGVTTNIMVTGNHRIWRHVIQSRTSAGAEEEIAKVIGQVAERFMQRYPAFYQDILIEEPTSDCPWKQYHFQNVKV